MMCCSIAGTFQTGINKCVFSQSIFLLVFSFCIVFSEVLQGNMSAGWTQKEDLITVSLI